MRHPTALPRSVKLFPTHSPLFVDEWWYGLYPALYRLEAKGWIAASWELSDIGKRARYYRITAKGRKQLAAEESRWAAFVRAMGLLLQPAHADFPDIR